MRHREATAMTETARVRRVYERAAPYYDRMIGAFERLLFAGGRRWAAERARGEVLEVAIGTGRNLGHYPPDVRLTGVDVSPGMLALARRRAGRLGRNVALSEADAQALPFPAARFDAVVCTLGLCSIPDARQAVAEAWRVLRPGGRLVLLEHVRSPLRPVGIAQELLEPLSVWLARDHLLREPLAVVRCQGFAVTELERAKLGLVERLAARKPEGEAA